MAIVYARLALFPQPDLAEAALLIGDILAEQDNLDGAIAAYEAVAPDSPLWHVAELRHARALHDIERQDEAFELLERLAAAEPERIDALVQLGDLLRRDERFRAPRMPTAGRSHASASPSASIGRCTTRVASPTSASSAGREAETDFLYALELEPEQPFVLNYLGYSWVDMGMNLDRAKAMLYRAVELRPDDGFIVDSLGWVHFRLGEYEDAVEQLERAVELEPGDPVINEHLGDAYWRVGREREARFQWRRALTLEPEEDTVADIEKKLARGCRARSRSRRRT